MNRITLFRAGLAALLCSASTSVAELASIGRSTVDGGGGPSSGGTFSLNGTIGQPDAGAMSGSAFTITGGFWSGVTNAQSQPTPALSALSIRLGTPVAGVNTVILSWPNPSTGYVLQQTVNLNAPGGGWRDVTQTPVINGANKEVTLQATGSSRLFRLRKP